MAEEVGVKEKVSGFLKTFSAELALEFYHDDIANAVKEFCKSFTTESLKQDIQKSQAPNIPNSFFELMSEYQAIVRGYNVEALTKIIGELIYEVRPDLGKTFDLLGDSAALWLYKCTEMIRDRIVNPEKFVEELEKAQTVKVTCESCHKEMRIFKEDAAELKQCPFCGAKGEEPEPSTSPEENVS